MRKILLPALGILLFFTYANYAQQTTLSTGKAPFNKSHSHINYGTSPLAGVAYANDNTTNTNISIPIPDGTPFTTLGSFSAPKFASSMCKGGDGNYYLTDFAGVLFILNPESGYCTLIGYISGMNGGNVNGISYNPANDSYYIVSNTAFYSFDINNLTATLIGNFSPAISGLMIDLCFDENGTCYAYEVNIDPGVAKAYIIDISDASLTPLGFVGFTPDYGQGMSYDFGTGTIYLSAFNFDTNSGQLRTMDKTTGMTTLLYDWGDQIAPFAIDSQYGSSCPVEAASNPNPPPGTMDVSTDGTTLTWDNGTGTTNIEVWFGTTGNVAEVYSGVPITSWSSGTLDYHTTYNWHIVDRNDTCGTLGPVWIFTTEQNPNLLVDDFYPMSAQYWTGNTEGTTKTDGEINTIYPNVGWAVYDISGIPQFSQIQKIIFYGYVNETNFPFWSATPMGMVNPVNDDAATINNQILASFDQSTAYIYSNEAGTFTTGWHNYPMGNGAIPDLQGAINSGQGWFAMGFVDRDFTTTYYINFDGWSQPNPPYLEITYVPTPVELTSFRADVSDGNIVLNWQTATETNNQGFEIQKSEVSSQPAGGEVSPKGGKTEPAYRQEGWEKIGFVTGSGTSTETHSYSFTDKNVNPGKPACRTGRYSYRLKQIDFDGTSNYSNEIEVNINEPTAFSLQQNYPNPFNPTTVIQYSIPSDKHVRLNIYNLLGQKVVTLVNGMQKAGQHEVNFNASSGSYRIASGVYFYKLEAGNQSLIKKMILMK